ncbi:glycyl-radical enzyme activating protein, partial [Desulfovibrio sp. OttesenSCG-928-C06]|nr:glycyl-radical enzyme activating protein [Desulfovibrio sp. OttesenSCG-928-C06]
MNFSSDALATGVVFNIQKYSVHDGPGIRTNVFLKGCPLRCRWCCNPESQAMHPELGYNADKCLGCSSCVNACAHGALELTERGVELARDLCVFDKIPCVDACHAEALVVYGRVRTVADVLGEVEQDTMFYSRSSGGLTLSGGEPLAQPEFVMALLREARKRHIHCAMETSSVASESVILNAAGLLDYLLMDVKSMDDALHREFTGVSNVGILSNISRVRAVYPELPIHIRTPVIPGFNDNENDIRKIAEFAASIGAVRYEPLAYHYMGRQKYKFIG